MTPKKLKDLLGRVEHRPEAAQEETLEALPETEEDIVGGPETPPR